MKQRQTGEIVGIVKSAGVGNRDIGRPALFLDVDLENGFSVLQLFTGDEMLKVIKDSEVYDVKDLAGRVCYLKKIDVNRSKFERWAT